MNAYRYFIKSARIEKVLEEENLKNILSLELLQSKILEMLNKKKSSLFYHGLILKILERKEDSVLVLVSISWEKENVNYNLSKNIMHNINNLITTVNNNAFLLKKYPQNSDTREIVDSIFEASKFIANISRSYLKYSILKDVNEITSFSIKEIIDECLNILSYRLIQNKISLIYKFEENIPFFKGVKGLIQQSFLSLMINAIESYDNLKIARDKNIIIKCFYQKPKFEISFIDNGAGISQEDLAKVFEPGFTTKEKGNGCGLNFCKSVVENYNGEIRISSKKNEGSIFVVKIESKG